MERTLRSKAIFERANNSYPNGSTRAPYYYAPYPLYIKKGEGCYISDLDGNKYIDFANNMGPLILGHRYPSVQKAVMQQVDTFWCGGPTELEVSLAEKVLEAFPMTDRLLFTPSGTEADMKLIRAARAMTRKKTIMMSTGAFHGTSDTLMPGPGTPAEIGGLIARYRYNDEEGFVTQFRKVKDGLAAVILAR